MGTENAFAVIETAHLAARLEALAAWYTPGAPRPAHYPAGEAAWLREAARRILQLAGDLEVVEHVQAAKGAHWKHWGVLNTEGVLTFATSFGAENARMHATTRAQRDVRIVPLIIGREAGA